MKLDKLKLDKKPFRIQGSFRVNGYPDQDHCPLIQFNHASLDPQNQKESLEHKHLGPIDFPVSGRAIVLNTVEEFKTFDMKEECQQRANSFIEYLDREIQAEDSLDLSRLFEENELFSFLVFPDLKSHVYSFKFWNVVVSSNAVKKVEAKDNELPVELGALIKSFFEKTPKKCPFLFVYGPLETNPVLSFELEEKRARECIGKGEFSVLIVDSYNRTNGVTNQVLLLMAVLVKYLEKHSDLKQHATRIPFLFLKDPVYIGVSDPMALKNSIKLVFDLSQASIGKNKKGEVQIGSTNTSEKVFDLRKFMDPKSLSEEAVDLNIRLMKWRMAPELDLACLHSVKCLLFGAGTLGCQLARNLLGWGVKNIDFVDAGTVSYSNPVRQSLYTFEDSKEGRPKAEAAAQRLKEVFPSVNSTGHQMKIPMPGHFVSTEKGLDEVMEIIEKMERLVEWADVIFLVTDTRESRWLPTLIAAAQNKLCISVALGFDNYIIIRHGGSPLVPKEETKEQVDRVGCYFCNDYIAPSNTLTDRTLDQQCTVTRPGLSYVSSAYATELMINILHFKDKNGPIGGHEVTQLFKDILKILVLIVKGC